MEFCAKAWFPDEQFDPDFESNLQSSHVPLVITEYEPTFDAADFTRCGRDIICQKSHVTREFGIAWLQRHLGDDYKIHTLTFNDRHQMHIDATLVPMASGKLLVNPERILEKPSIFRGWDMLYAPQPIMSDDHPLYMTSKWINMNILMLDKTHVMVEAQDEPMIQSLKKLGFQPVRFNFRHFNSFGGSFHCSTLDVRRRGYLKSYLVWNLIFFSGRSEYSSDHLGRRRLVVFDQRNWWSKTGLTPSGWSNLLSIR